jgi:hypothetical protein
MVREAALGAEGRAVADEGHDMAVFDEVADEGSVARGVAAVVLDDDLDLAPTQPALAVDHRAQSCTPVGICPTAAPPGPL